MQSMRQPAKSFMLPLIGVCVAAYASHATATAISGQGLPASHAELTGGTVVDFEANTSGEFATSFTYPGVTMTGAPGNKIMWVLNNFDAQFNVTGNSLALTTNDRTQEIVFDFTAPVSAFGFNLGGTDEAWRLIAYSASSTILDEVLLPVINNANDGQWYGIAVQGIASARLYNTAFDNTGGLDYIVIDNFTFASHVPEPATLALLVLGLLGLGVSRARKT